MKAVSFDRFGPLDVLGISQVEDPQVSKGQVLVAVKATSVNVIDSRVRNGVMGPLVNKKFPKIPGSDFAGIVKSVGAGVGSFKAGDEVYGAADPLKGGAFAELIAVSQDQVAKKPKSLTFEEAASVPITSLAALISLKDLGRVRRGDSVLIHGASGALGLSAIQLGREMGANVTAVVGTSGVEIAKSYGASLVLDYTKQDGTHFDQLFDVIINASGKFPFNLGKKYLKRSGKFVEPSPSIPVFIGSKIANLFRAKKHLTLQTLPKTRDLDLLSEKIKSAALKPTVASKYSFYDFKKAFSEMEKGGVIGKVVVTI